MVKAAPARPSFGQIYGLHATDDPLDLKSSVALVIDQDTQQVLFSKNPQAVLPIASITKLMTALVVTEAGLPLDEMLAISQDDVDTEKGSRSRLTVGTQLTRGEMLLLALMSSENRAAHALGRHYPGGMDAFVGAMNAKAQLLGMGDTRYVEPTGLSSQNRSSANDLARLVDAAYAHPIIRELSTSREAQVDVGKRQLQFRNTNGLVRNPEWDIGLQKTGYISEAGRCLVMQANWPAASSSWCCSIRPASIRASAMPSASASGSTRRCRRRRCSPPSRAPEASAAASAAGGLSPGDPAPPRSVPQWP